MDEMSFISVAQKSPTYSHIRYSKIPNLLRIDILKQGVSVVSRPPECPPSARVASRKKMYDISWLAREAAAAPNQIPVFSRIDFPTHRATNTFDKSSLTHLDAIDIFSLVNSLRIHMLTWIIIFCLRVIFCIHM